MINYAMHLQVVLPEQATDFIEEYVEKFRADMTHFEFR